MLAGNVAGVVPAATPGPAPTSFSAAAGAGPLSSPVRSATGVSPQDGGFPNPSVASLSLLNNTVESGWSNFLNLQSAGTVVADPIAGVDAVVGECYGLLRPDVCVGIVSASGPTPLSMFAIDQCAGGAVGSQSAIANPSNGLLYVGCGNGSVTVVEPLSGTVIAQIPAPTPTEYPVGCPEQPDNALSSPVVGMAIDPNDGTLFVMSVSLCGSPQSPYPWNASLEEISLATDLPIWNFTFQSLENLDSYLPAEPLAFDPTTDQLVVSTTLNGTPPYQTAVDLVDPGSPQFAGSILLVPELELFPSPVVFLPSTGSLYTAVEAYNGPSATPWSVSILRLDPAAESAVPVYQHLGNLSVAPLPFGQWLDPAVGGSAELTVTGAWAFDRNATNGALAPPSDIALWTVNVSSGIATAAVGLPGSGIVTVPGPASTTLFLDGLDAGLVPISGSPPVVGSEVPLGGFPLFAVVDPDDSTAWIPDFTVCEALLGQPCTNASLDEVSGVSQHVVGRFALPAGLPIGAGFDPVDQEIYVLSSCVPHDPGTECFDQPNGTMTVYAPNGTPIVTAAVPEVYSPGPFGPLTFDPNGSFFVAGQTDGRGAPALLIVGANDPNLSDVFVLPPPAGGTCYEAPSVAYDGGSGLLLASTDCDNGSGLNGYLWAYNATTFQLVYVAPVPRDLGALTYDPGSGLLFAANGSGVYVIAPANGTVLTYLPVPGGALYLADDPVTGIVYSDATNVTAINATSLAISTVAVLPNGSGSADARIAVDPTLGTLYLPSANLDSVSLVAAPGPATFRVAVPVAGLPNGQTWTVTLAGTPETSFGTLSFSVPNGTYGYSIGPVAGYRLVGDRVGTVHVAGANVTLAPVEFLPNYYTLSFDGSGGPWTVYLDGPDGPVPTTGCGTTPGLGVTSCLVTNGTYHYLLAGTVGSVITEASPAGAVTIAGSSAAVSFRLTPGATAGLTFHETGLPPGTSWRAVVDDAAVACSTATAVTVSDLTPGAYSYLIEGVPGFTARVAGGSVSLARAHTVAVAFRVATTVLTFTETGLAPHHRWSVVVDGRTYATTHPDIQVAVPNGTVAYFAPAIAGYLGHASGNVTVTGVPRSIAVSFARVTYLVTITETGLASAAFWAVDVGGVRHPINGSTLVLEEPNGTYSVRVVPEAGYAARVTPSSIRIDGAGASVAIVFRPVSGSDAAAPAAPLDAVRRS